MELKAQNTASKNILLHECLPLLSEGVKMSHNYSQIGIAQQIPQFTPLVQKQKFRGLSTDMIAFALRDRLYADHRIE